LSDLNPEQRRLVLLAAKITGMSAEHTRRGGSNTELATEIAQEKQKLRNLVEAVDMDKRTLGKGSVLFDLYSMDGKYAQAGVPPLSKKGAQLIEKMHHYKAPGMSWRRKGLMREILRLRDELNREDPTIPVNWIQEADGTLAPVPGAARTGRGNAIILQHKGTLTDPKAELVIDPNADEPARRATQPAAPAAPEQTPQPAQQPTPEQQAQQQRFRRLRRIGGRAGRIIVGTPGTVLGFGRDIAGGARAVFRPDMSVYENPEPPEGRLIPPPPRRHRAPRSRA
jgi:hypothetical protein